MEVPQTLTVASTWKFEKDAVEHIRRLFKATSAAGVGFCKYEPINNVFVVDNCDVIGSASEMSSLVAKYVDAEKDNDTMEIPKVSRLGPPNAPYEISYEDDIIEREKGALIDDFSPGCESTKIPITTKYWKSSLGDIGGFKKLRYAIDEVSRLSGAEIVFEESNARIRVFSYVDSNIVDDAMRRLSNLHTSLSLSITPQVSHILNVFPQTEFHVKLSPYADLHKNEVCRILVDPERKDIGQLSKMFVTMMVARDSESHNNQVSINVTKPPRQTEPRKGRSKIWADFKFQGLGDASNAPRFRDSVRGEAEPVQQSQLKININIPLPTAPLAGGAPVGKHRFLTREKASFVDNWAAQVEIGTDGSNGSGPHSTSPLKLHREPSQSVPPPGIKRRKAVVIDTEGNISTPIEDSKPFPSAEASTAGQDKSATNEDVAVQRALRLPVNFNSYVNGQPDCPSAQNAKPTEQAESAQLIDLEDSSPLARTGVPPVPYMPVPLVPPKTSSLALTVAKCHPKHAKENKARRSEEPSAENNPRIHEPEPRVFHRIMGQKAGNNAWAGDDRKSKAENPKIVVDTLSAPSILSRTSTSCSSGFSSKSIQLSGWKKAQQAKENEIREAAANEFLRQISVVLNGARCFPGSVSFEIQLGLVLANPAALIEHKDELLNIKAWNRLFQPKNNLPKPGTVFTNMLTTSGADVDYILDLPISRGVSTCSMFSEEGISRHIWYEFHCTTKNDETLVVIVDESGTAVVNRPESVLGAVNVHCAGQTWDMRGVVKGAVEYIRGDEEIDQAIQNLIDKMYIEPGLSEVVIFTRIPEEGQLQITKVLMKRSTRHRFHQHETGSLRVSTAEKSTTQDRISALFNDQGSESAGSVNGHATPFGNEGPFLQITEVQNLFLACSVDDKMALRARAISADKMVDDRRLWYEMSVINPTIEEILRSNKDLEFGDAAASWSVFKPPPTKKEKRSINTITTAKASETSLADSKFPEQTTSEIRSTDVSEMFHAANKIVQQIDNVGRANFRPEAQVGLKVEQTIMDRSMTTTVEEPVVGYW
ncbi:hypothetical protein GX51_04310 [Blastomyces parvus]|uniref:Uncharacterized protein n=1 Tax=Blastomyces parvus TaxID=2060905 RepID=A0A2B7X2M1_9EURO|nr:hypothetical protein GX51_04310 [Blastomyces parvus]